MGKVLKSLTLGSIIGFVAGLLFAPQEGEKTRKKVQDAVEKGKNKFEELKKEITQKD
jgi:gas vesicle protein